MCVCVCVLHTWKRVVYELRSMVHRVCDAISLITWRDLRRTVVVSTVNFKTKVVCVCVCVCACVRVRMRMFNGSCPVLF